MIAFDDLVGSADGLVVAVIQDAATKDVLMVGYMDRQALDATQSTGTVHFWSRSRQELWKKGESSGNTLTVTDIRADCDRDVLLVAATPAGPTCHSGTATCFGDADTTLGGVVDRLAAIVASRTGVDPTSSYTATLMEDPDLAARKVLEEAGEVAFAAKDALAGGSLQRVVEEAADEVYHLLTLLAALGIAPHEIAAELSDRMVADSGT